MEREHRRRSAPGREYGEESSRRPYSDEQETYRNPRNEYQHSRRDYEDARGDAAAGPQQSQLGYGQPDTGYEEDQRRELSGERGHGQSRDTRLQPREGDFSDARTRWPRDDKYRSEPRSQNWPHSRSGGSDDVYFGDESRQARPYGDRRAREFQYGYGQQSQATQGEPGRSGNYRGVGPKNYSRSDERIREDLCERLSEDPECDAADIEIEVRDGNVVLSGTVPARYMKHRAEDIADDTRGVRDIDNRVRVRVARREGASSGPQPGSDGAVRESKGRQSSKPAKSGRSSRH